MATEKDYRLLCSSVAAAWRAAEGAEERGDMSHATAIRKHANALLDLARTMV